MPDWKAILADTQIKNAAKLLGGSIVHQQIVWSNGEESRRVVIEYDMKKKP